MTTYNTDTFVRANVSGSWGTATDGSTWVHTGSGTPNVTSNEGIIPSTPSNTDELYIGSTHTDMEVLVRFSITSNVDTAAALLRYNSGTDSGYWMGYDGQVSTGHIYITNNSSGTKTSLASGSMTLTNGTFYWVRAQAIGTALKVRIWQDGGSEPSTWNLTTTNSTYTSGYAGVVANSNGTGIKFDHFSSTSGATSTTATLTDTALGVTDTSTTIDIALASDLLSLIDASKVAPIWVLEDDLTEIEAVFSSISFAVPVDQNIVGEAATSIVATAITDTLSTTDIIGFSTSPAGYQFTDATLNTSDAIVPASVYVPAETLANTNTVSTVLALVRTENAGTLSDTIAGVTYSLVSGIDYLTITEPDDPLYLTLIFTLAASIVDGAAIASDQTKNTGESRPVDSNAITESFTSSTSTNIQLVDSPASLSETQQMALAVSVNEPTATSDTLSYSIFSAIVGTDQLTLPDDTIAFFNTPIFIDTPLVSSDAIVYSYTFIPGTISGSKVFSTDSFARTVSANSWGSASDGTSGSWTTRTSTGMSWAVNGSAGTIKDTATGDTLDIVLGSQTYKDCEYVADVSFGSNSDGTGLQLIMRADTTSQGIFIGFTSQTAFAITRNDGSYAVVASTTISGIAANTTYRIRARLVGGVAMGKYWQVGTAEPATWTVQTTTGITVTAAGKIGVTCSPGSTNTTYTIDNVYVVDYPLADRVTNVDASVPTVVASPIDTLSTSDSLATASTNIVSLINPVLILTESSVASFAYAIIDATLLLSDAGSGTSYPIGMYDASSTPVTETFLSSISTGESGSFALVEIVAYNTVLAPVEQLNETEQYQEALSYSTAETLSLPDDRVAPLFLAPLFDDALTPSDSIVPTDIAAPIDALVSVSNVGYGIFFTNIPEQSFIVDTVVFAYPIPLPDVPMAIVDASSFTLFLPDFYILTQTDQSQISIAQIKTESLTVADAKSVMLFSQIQDADDALTIADSVVGGQPAFLNDVPLTLTDALIHGGYFPLGGAGDTLIVTETLYVLNNLTDLVSVQESILVTTELHILDRRADQYSSIVSDHPNVYYQCNEDSFTGIFQKDGQDLPANASISALAGAVLPYTWAQLEPQEGNYNWALVDNDIAAWTNQGKKVILCVFTGGTVVGNSKSHYGNTAGNATPAWVYSTYGARSVTEIDGSVYPVYWDPNYQQQYAAFVTAFGLRYDTSPNVAVVVAGIGCFGQTSLDQSGNPSALALWQYQGYTPDLWTQTVDQYIQLYQQAFVHTSVALSVDSAYLVPDSMHNIDTMISLAIKHGVWLEDNNVYVGSTHSNPSWNVVPVIAGQANPASVSGDTLDQDLRLATLYRAYYATIATSDITAINIATLATYADSVLPKMLSDSGSNNVELAISDGIYPVSHINPGDYLNGAQQCNGLTSYAYANQAAQTNLTDWTIKATIYPTVLPTAEAIIIANGREGYDAGGYALGIAGGANGGPGANVCVFLPGVGWIDSGYILPQAMQWYSLMAVYTAGSLSFYVNGVQAPNVTACAPLAVPPMLTVGAGWDNLNRMATRHFIGSIDELAVYPFAVSPIRIAALAALETGMSDSTVGSGPQYLFFDQNTVDDSASTFTPTRNIADVALAASESLTYSIKTIADTYPVIIAQDNFNRLNQNGWGTASDGQVWQHAVGTSNWSIVGNQGQITGAAVANYMLLGSHVAGMEEGIARFSVDDPGNGVGICLRVQDGNNLYRARLYGGNFGIIRLSNGSATNLVLSNPYSLSTGVYYWIRFRAYKSQLLAKFWAEPDHEPAAWTLSTTDTNYVTGGVGIFAQIVNTGTTIVDNFYVVDNNLTDQLMVMDSYQIQVVPPFAPELLVSSDSTTWTEGLQYFDNGDQLTLIDVETINSQQVPIDFAPPVETFATALAWMIEDDPILVEVLLATMARTLGIDQLAAPTDVLVPNNIMAPIDTLQITDGQAEALFASLLDPFVVIDATQFTQSRSFSNQTIMGQDGIGYTSIPLEITQLVSTETIMYVLFDQPVTVTPLSDTIMSTLASSRSDSVLPSDTVTPIPIFGPSDILSISEAEASSSAFFIQDMVALTSDTLFDVETVAIADAAIVTELINGGVNQKNTDTVLSLDSLFYPLISQLQDQLVASDVVMTAVSLALSDTVAASDVIIPTNQNWIADALLPADSIMNVTQPLEMDITILAEGLLEQIVFMQTDVTPPANLNAATLVFFFTTDISLTSDITFLIEAVSLTDLSITSDASLNVNILVAADQMIEIEAIAKQGFYLPVDGLAPLDSTFETTAETLSDAVLLSGDAIAVQQANSFTGWVDLLYLAEIGQIGTQMAPVEQLGLVESTAYALREVLQGNSLALYGENLIASFTIVATDATVEGERIVSSITLSTSDQCFMSDISAASNTFVPVELLATHEAFQLLFALSVADILVVTEQGVSTPLYAIVEAVGTLTEVTALQGQLTSRDALLALENINTAIVSVLVEILNAVDTSTLQPQYQPVDIVAEAEAVAFAAQLKYSDTLPLTDASTTTTIALDSGQLTLALEADAFTIRLIPVDTVSQQDVSTERLAVTFPVDSLAVLELNPSLGYSFADSLYIQELLNGTSQSYMLIYGQILSGQIDGVVLSGKINGVVLSGQIDGVLS